MKWPMIDMKQMNRKQRRPYDYRKDAKIEIVQWNDNSVVTLGSNVDNVEPVGTAQRWVKSIEKSNVNQPAVISVYNQGMGGVDLLNHALSDLRPVIQGKKWY